MSVEFNSGQISNNNPEIKNRQDEQNGQGEQAKSTQSSPTLFTKSVFMNNINSALQKHCHNKQQRTQFSQQAGSIFDKYDKDQNQEWSQAESENGGAYALSSFYEKVNNALQGIKETNKIEDVQQAGDVEQTRDVTETVTPEEVKSAEQAITTFNKDLEAICKRLGIDYENMTAADIQKIKETAQEDIDALKNAGFDAKLSSDMTTIELTDKDGNSGVINLATGEASGCGDAAIQAMKKAAEALNAGGAADAEDSKGTETALNNLSAALDKYSQKGFKPTGTPVEKTINGEKVLVGTLQNQSGEQIQINLKTGEEIKE